MSNLETGQLEIYLSQLINRPVLIQETRELGGSAKGAAALKAFGYGRPLAVTFQSGDVTQKVVLRRVKRNGFGRERDSDRAAEVWRDYQTFNRLPRHVQAQDIVMLTETGGLQSIAEATELLLVTDYASGQIYANDLLEVNQLEQSLARAYALASYLAKIHAVKHNDPLLWRRRLRDLIGHGEGIMGLTDSYDKADPIVTPQRLQHIEKRANEWRWLLKPYQHRLSQVHGDFHPFNILFSEGNEFLLLDRSRGEWGEPADDVSCLMINYLFFSLQRSNKLEGPLWHLYNTFWQTYLNHSGDQELLEVIAPWISWRALVLASPQWYPTLNSVTRTRLLNLATNVLEGKRFDWTAINDYLE